MEKLTQENQNQISETKSSSNLWDCGSTLYDSFELNSFKRQLNSAIANSPRTLSLSHLPERRLLPLQPLPQPISSVVSKKHFKISRSFQKFLRSVFKFSNKSTGSTSTSNFQVPEKYSKERFHVFYDKSGPVLSMIPEVPEFEVTALSPEIASFVTRSVSERFTATAIGVSCA